MTILSTTNKTVDILDMYFLHFLQSFLYCFMQYPHSGLLNMENVCLLTVKSKVGFMTTKQQFHCCKWLYSNRHITLPPPILELLLKLAGVGSEA